MKNLVSILFFCFLLTQAFYAQLHNWDQQNLSIQPPIQVTFESGGVSDFVWSPDGSQFAYIATYNDTTRLNRIDLDGSNKTELYSNAYGQIDWKDTVIVFMSYDPGIPSYNNLIKKINPDGSGASTIIGPDWYTGVYLRADANWILYRQAPNGWWKAMRCDLNGGNQLALSQNPGSTNSLVQQVSWLGENQVIYSHGTNYYTTGSIWRVNFDGNNRITLNAGNLPNNTTFIASPDTNKILFCDGTGNNWDIYIMNIDGSNPTQLTLDPARDYISNTRDNIWSEDCQSFYFVSDRSGNGDIYRLNVDGSNLTQITYNDSIDYNPIPSPDGSKLAFISKRDGVNNIWVIDLIPVGWFQQNSGTTENLYDVSFSDENNGIVVGGHTILKTTNGGLIWSLQYFGYNAFVGVCFIDENTGWIVGLSGIILKTTDGGTNWNSQYSGTSAALRDVCFTDAMNGTAVGDNNTIIRTSNGGSSWVAQSSGITANYFWGVFFIDTNNGWIVGSNGGSILKTTNGGIDWTSGSYGSGYDLTGVSFADINNGIVVGGGGQIFRTTNGGIDWTLQTSGISTWLLGVSCSDENNFTAVGDNGKILKTTDGGINWTQQSSGTTTSLRSVSCADLNNITVVGLNGTILRTWNGGFGVPLTTFSLLVSIHNGWNMVSIPGLHPINQNVETWWPGKDPNAQVVKYNISYQPVTAATPGEGYWMKHIGAQIYNTGDEWPSGGILFVPHEPVDGNVGWNLFGGYENIVATSSLTTTPPGLIEGPIYKYSGTYEVADNLIPGYGYWVRLTGEGQINIPDIECKGSGELAKYFKEDWGKIIITDNTGKSFTLYAVKSEVDLNKYELPPHPPVGIFDIRFSSGRIAEDLSKGIQIIEMSGIQYPVTVEVENMSITLQDESGSKISKGLYPGEELKIENRSIHKLVVLSGEFTAPIKYSLEQNYPNPFNPTTTIEFSIPEATKVTLTIYNILGEKVDVLVNSELEPGKYSYKWSGKNLATGLYIYELRTDNFVSVKKMLLLK